MRLKSLHTVGIAVNISDTEKKMTITGENVHVNTIMSILYFKGWGHAFCLLRWPNIDLVPLPTQHTDNACFSRIVEFAPLHWARAAADYTVRERGVV